MTGARRAPPLFPLLLHAQHSTAYETSRADIQALVPSTARRVLDVGCAAGALGASLKQRQRVEVIGIEHDALYAREAERRLDRVLQGDLDVLVEQAGLVEEVGSVDCLIAADVLEHLRDPWRALRVLANTLADGGTAVISLPNVRHWRVLVELGVRGRWPQEDWGTFDRTHLRWFTLADAQDLLTQADLHLRGVQRNYSVRPASLGERLVPLVDRSPVQPFFVYQYLLLAAKSVGSLAGA